MLNLLKYIPRLITNILKILVIISMIYFMQYLDSYMNIFKYIKFLYFIWLSISILYDLYLINLLILNISLEKVDKENNLPKFFKYLPSSWTKDIRDKNNIDDDSLFLIYI